LFLVGAGTSNQSHSNNVTSCALGKSRVMIYLITPYHSMPPPLTATPLFCVDRFFSTCVVRKKNPLMEHLSYTRIRWSRPRDREYIISSAFPSSCRFLICTQYYLEIMLGTYTNVMNLIEQKYDSLYAQTMKQTDPCAFSQHSACWFSSIPRYAHCNK
jgi:hypothetical protein